MFNFTTQKANVVCPYCGLVWKDGKPYEAASNIEDWVAYGYEPTACPDCIKAGKCPDDVSWLEEMIDEGLSKAEVQKKITDKFTRQTEWLNGKLKAVK